MENEEGCEAGGRLQPRWWFSARKVEMWGGNAKARGGQGFII